jgi:hypothetical protein
VLTVRIGLTTYDDEASATDCRTPRHDDVHQGFLGRDAAQSVVTAGVCSVDRGLWACVQQRSDQKLASRRIARPDEIDRGEQSLPLVGVEAMSDRARGKSGRQRLRSVHHVVLRSHQTGQSRIGVASCRHVPSVPSMTSSTSDERLAVENNARDSTCG